MAFKVRRRLSVLGVGLLTAAGAFTSIAVAVVGTANPAAADTNGCPSSGTGNPKVDNFVGASFTTNGNTVTYVFDSFVNELPTGGIPGLIDYCVYPTNPTAAPDSTTVAVPGWKEPGSDPFTNFSFSRPDGDPSNIPLDGTQNITMGTATWSTNPVPSSQTIILHINDPSVCKSLYPSESPLTCFVLPGQPTSQAAPLTIFKTASGAYTDTFPWSISKQACEDGVTSCTQEADQSSTSATFDYTVTVSHGNSQIGDVKVTGTITVTNPNQGSVLISGVTDTLSDGTKCAVDNVPASVPSGNTQLSYSCDLSNDTSVPSGLTNTATVSWDNQQITDGTLASGSATTNEVPVSFTGTEKDTCVTVTDTLGSTLGTVCAGKDPNPMNFNYPLTFTGTPGTCTSFPNTATFTTNDTGTTGSASQTVKVCVGEDLQVSKTANPSFTRTYNWSIAKAVDKTLVEQIGGTATFNYTVNAAETGFVDSAWQVAGSIKVTNPNDWEAVTANVTDATDNGGSCTVAGGNAVSIPASSSVTLSYTCTYDSAPSASSGTNTATATWDKATYFTPDGTATGNAKFAFDTPTTTVNPTITVTDTFNGTTTTLGTLTATDAPPFASATYTYSHTVNVPTFNCVKYTNTAKIVETGQSDSKTVEVCGPAKTGALTMGFWQNKNGQTIIKNYSGTNCQALATWLTQFHPFSDLTATSCGSSPSLGATIATGVVGYVYNVIKAATCMSTSKTCNSMLKAQMLATALDVYFSDPSLGGNRINAPAPIGGVTIDLTKICQMIDGSGGTATCSGNFENVSAAFGGATSMTAMNMLLYQNTADPAADGGANWYGQVKATQVLAKDAFDAINNQVAFSP